MKRIKAINGYTIYQATTDRDEENYRCRIGNYNVYLSSDIRDFGLANSYPEWDDEDSLAVVIARCNGSHYAVACELADELSNSTIQDMDLVMEIERRLEAGEALETIRKSYDTEEQSFIEGISYEAFLDLARANYCKGGDGYFECCDRTDFEDLVRETGPITEARALEMFRLAYSIDQEYQAATVWASGESTTEDEDVQDSYQGVVSDNLFIFDDPADQKIAYPDGRVYCLTFDELLDLAAREFDNLGYPLEFSARLATPDEIETYGTSEARRDDAALADGPEGDLEDVMDRALAEAEDARVKAEAEANWVEWTDGFCFRRETDQEEIDIIRASKAPLHVCVYADTTGFYTEAECDDDNMVYVDFPTGLVYDYISEQVGFPVQQDDFWYWYLNEYTCDCTINLVAYAREHGFRPVMLGWEVPEQYQDFRPWGSHASYAVLRDPDTDESFTITYDAKPGWRPEDRIDALLGTVAKHYAFNDCGGYDVVEVVLDGRPVVYDGWRPMMEMIFRDALTGEIVYDEFHDEWDH